jgi:hypothetical protein
MEGRKKRRRTNLGEQVFVLRLEPGGGFHLCFVSMYLLMPGNG